MSSDGTFDTPPLEGLAVENASKDLPILPAARAPLSGASGALPVAPPSGVRPGGDGGAM